MTIRTIYVVGVLLLLLFFLINCVVTKQLDITSLFDVFIWPIIIFGFVLIVIFAFLSTVAEVVIDKISLHGSRKGD